jgi:hypothetical protein
VLGQAEVAHLEQGLATAIQQTVFELDVTVGDAHAVAVVQCKDVLLEESARFTLLCSVTSDTYV